MATATVPPPPITAMAAPGSEWCHAQNPSSRATRPVAPAATSGPAAAQHVAGDGRRRTDVERVDAAVDGDPDPSAHALHGLLGEARSLGAEDQGDPLLGGEDHVVD